MIVLFASFLLAAYNPIINSARVRLKRVENGRQVLPNSQPWMATLNLDSSPVCGAFLISRGSNLHRVETDGFSDILLTAGHCVVDKHGRKYFSHSRLSVSFGKHLMNVPELNQVNFSIIQVSVHPKFQISPTMYDIAMLKLMQPVQMNKYIKPIPLMNISSLVDECTVSGWGHHWDRIGQRISNIVLRSVDVYNLTDQGMFIQGSIPSNIRIITGDSGSPLICTIENQTMAMGIVSISKSDYTANYFTNIPHVLPWIMESINTIDQLVIFNDLLEVYSTRQISYDVEEIEHLSYGVFGHLSTSFDRQLTINNMDQIDFKQIWFMESLNDKVKIHQDMFYMHDTIGFTFMESVYKCAVMCYLKNQYGVCSYLVGRKKCFFSTSRFMCYNQHCARLGSFEAVTIIFDTEIYSPGKQVTYAEPVAVAEHKFLESLWKVSIGNVDRPSYHCTGTPYYLSDSRIYEAVAVSVDCLKLLNGHSKDNFAYYYLEATVTFLSDGKAHRMEITLNPSHMESETVYIDISSMNITLEADDLDQEWELQDLNPKPLLKRHSPQSGAFIVEPFTRPWMVYLWTNFEKRCVGALIKEIGNEGRNETRFVLTSLSCAKANARSVTVGKHYLYLKSYFEKDVYVDKVWAKNDSENETHGIGLIKLKQAVPFHGYVQPIELLAERSAFGTNELKLLSWDIKCADNHNALYEIPVKSVKSEDPIVIETKRSYFWQESGITCKQNESDGKPLVMFDASSRQHVLVGFHASQYNGLIEKHTPVWRYMEWIRDRMKHADDSDEDGEDDYDSTYPD